MPWIDNWMARTEEKYEEKPTSGRLVMQCLSNYSERNVLGSCIMPSSETCGYEPKYIQQSVPVLRVCGNCRHFLITTEETKWLKGPKKSLY